MSLNPLVYSKMAQMTDIQQCDNDNSVNWSLMSKLLAIFRSSRTN